MQWESYRNRWYGGKKFATKAESFAPYESLPSRVTMSLELALGGETAPRESLSASGWHISDPLQIARTPWDYQDYIRESRGEFAVAKHGYVASGCGWFSERSACYLASGRPVVTQDTGFTDVLPCGAGLLAFNNPDEAINSLEEVEMDLALHRAAARSVVEEHFRSDIVLSDLIECSVAPRT